MCGRCIWVVRSPRPHSVTLNERKPPTRILGQKMKASNDAFFSFFVVNGRNAILDFLMGAAPHANGHLYRTDADQLVFHVENPFKRFLVFVSCLWLAG